jgi:hypothetical protein
MRRRDARSAAEPSAKVIWTAERDMMVSDINAEQDKARRFRDAALPHLDDVFALARYLMRARQFSVGLLEITR